MSVPCLSQKQTNQENFDSKQVIFKYHNNSSVVVVWYNQPKRYDHQESDAS